MQVEGRARAPERQRHGQLNADRHNVADPVERQRTLVRNGPAIIGPDPIAAEYVRNGANGSVNLTTTVVASGVSMPDRPPNSAAYCDGRSLLSFLKDPVRVMYSMLHLASADVTSRPLTGARLANFAPLTRWKVNVRPSGVSHFSARPGTKRTSL